MPIICAYPPTIWQFLSAWLDSCLHGSGFKGALSYRRRADHDNSTFISRKDFSGNFHCLHGVMGVSTSVFFETRGLAVLRFLSCAANVQGTHRLPVTCVPVLCFIVEKLINLFKLVVALIYGIRTYKFKKNSWKEYQIYYFIFNRYYI